MNKVTNAHDFVASLLADRALMRDAVAYATFLDIDADDDEALGKTFAASAERLGHVFSVTELNEEAKAQIKSLGMVRGFLFAADVTRTQRRAIRASECCAAHGWLTGAEGANA